jgi:hypothetical protein
MKRLVVIVFSFALVSSAHAWTCERPPVPECDRQDQYAFATCEQEYQQQLAQYDQCREDEQAELQRQQEEEQIRRQQQQAAEEQQQRLCQETGNMAPSCPR